MSYTIYVFFVFYEIGRSVKNYTNLPNIYDSDNRFFVHIKATLNKKIQWSAPIEDQKAKNIDLGRTSVIE